MNRIKSLTPIESRYGSITINLENYFSEWALMKFRTHIEVEWLITMASNPEFHDIRGLTIEEIQLLRNIVANFNEELALKIKEIEKVTNHDVKAVEYFLREMLKDTSLSDVIEFIHFACTSEDINNLSYALMLKHGMNDVWLPMAKKLVDEVANMAEELKDVPMLSHTHGQPASPTTVGKELAIFIYRWNRQLKLIHSLEYLGKFNGAVGNFNAHKIAYPDVEWEKVSKGFVCGLGLEYNPLTTQIESHDYMAECFHAISRFNNIVLDFDKDIWLYISLGYFKLKAAKGEVGSSTMPHKVNPIDFENAEANLGISNSILGFLANKLPISRMQRDLSDSSALRNIGTAIAYSYIAINSTLRGVGKISINPKAIEDDFEEAWEVIAEAVQTVMRKHGYCNPYERLKEITRGKMIGKEEIRAFISSVELPEEDKTRLMELTPQKYIGLADKLVKHISPTGEFDK